MSSNQGRDIDAVLAAVTPDDLADVARSALWPEVRAHPDTASCECPVVETIARLYELGYVLIRPGGTT